MIHTYIVLLGKEDRNTLEVRQDKWFKKIKMVL